MPDDDPALDAHISPTSSMLPPSPNGLRFGLNLSTGTQRPAWRRTAAPGRRPVGHHGRWASSARRHGVDHPLDRHVAAHVVGHGRPAGTACSASPIRSVSPRSGPRASSRWRRRSSTSPGRRPAGRRGPRGSDAVLARCRCRQAFAPRRRLALLRGLGASRFGGLGRHASRLLIDSSQRRDGHLLDLVALAQPGVGLGAGLGDDPLGLLRAGIGAAASSTRAAASPGPARRRGTPPVPGGVGEQPAGDLELGGALAEPDEQVVDLAADGGQLRLRPGRVVVDLQPVVAVQPDPEDRPEIQQLVEIAGQIGPGDGAPVVPSTSASATPRAPLAAPWFPLLHVRSSGGQCQSGRSGGPVTAP